VSEHGKINLPLSRVDSAPTLRIHAAAECSGCSSSAGESELFLAQICHWRHRIFSVVGIPSTKYRHCRVDTYFHKTICCL